MKLVTAAEMRALEQRAVEAGVSLDELMANAGLAVAQEVWMQLGSLEGRRILVLVGPGNNGGDGLVAARHLADWGAQVRCYALRPRDDAQWRQTLAAGVPCGAVAEDDGFEALDEILRGAEAIVDALLGTGPRRPIEGDLAEILSRVARARERTVRPKLIAVDLPTGLHADSGALDPLTVAADLTVTFHAPKVGLYLQPGAAAAGAVQTVDIGVPSGLDADLDTEILDRRGARALLPERPPDAHKGTFGRLLVIAGSSRYPGAAVLAASAGYRVGAGLVSLAAPASILPGLAAAMPEVTLLPLPDQGAPGAFEEAALPLLRQELGSYQAMTIGCGLGQDPATVAAVRALLADAALKDLQGIVIDADGLNAIAGSDWAAALPAPAIITPHPGEMSRLLDRDTGEIQGARLHVARGAARDWSVTAVLKGANTIVAGADGATRVSGIASAALATAGTGDVLAGAIGGLLAQGVAPFAAASLAVFLHADAGVRAAKARGTAGTTARDVLEHLALAGRGLAGEEPLESPGLGLGALSGLGGGGLGGGGADDPGGLAALLGGGPGDDR